MVKRKLSKMRVAAVPFVLCIALILSGILSVQSINNLQGNARIINYTGIVRGATQRLIKKELNYNPDDSLMERIDDILVGLDEGSKELNLIKLNAEEFQSLLLQMQTEWEEIKTEIALYRQQETSGERLFNLSEDFFNLADETVMAAEVYTEKVVMNARNQLFYMNGIFILLAGLCTVYAFMQEKRRIQLNAAEEENRKKGEQLSQRFQELLVPMNEITELLYVSDIETNELLFANEMGKKTFHITDDAHLKCYKALQGLDAPCPFCTTQHLKEGETYTWEHTNLITHRHYLLKDRLMEWNGRPARMEIAFDITDAANEKNELKNRLERDNVLVECIREFYRNQDMLDASSHVLKRIGELFSADRAYIFSFHGEAISNIAEWCQEEIEPQIEHLQNLPKSEFQIWLNMFDHQQNIVIHDLNDIKEMSYEYAFLAQQGIQNVIMVPLERDGQLDGCIGLDNPEHKLMENAVTFLETLRYYIMLAMRREEDEKALYHLSYVDTLTSFYNRNRYIQDINRLKEKEESVGVIYLDVNGLKEINDRFGHDAGDALLKKCAKIIQKSIINGSFYRIGGDEFIIICLGIEEESFKEHLYGLKNNLSHEECTAAIGYKWENNCHHIQKIINQADEFMYTDKKEFYHRHLETGRYRHQNDVLDYLSDPSLLKDKIANKKFQVYLQAKLDVETHALVGAEALVRYLDDDGMIQPPDRFIPVLENTYQISKIDFYVFETICAQLQTWQKQGKQLFPISSNFSRITFMEENLLEKLETIIQKYGISKQYLEVEITESTCSSNCKGLTDQINQIREAGFLVSVDDFGAESSNLALLATAQFDILKIDQGFVKDIVSNTYAQSIVEAMVGVCNKRGIHLIAEGVENEEQFEVLKNCGVKTVQGFLFSKPIPMKQYEWRYLNTK